MPKELGLEITFLQENAQETGFADETFDAVVTRNLTWTLPDTKKAYEEWKRVLVPGGVLINFDAAYGKINYAAEAGSWMRLIRRCRTVSPLPVILSKEK